MVKSFLLMLAAIVVVSVVSAPAIILNTLRKTFRRESIKKYFFTIAIGFDQAGGSILYGKEDWTVSSWTYYLSQRGNRYATVFMRFIDRLFGRDHCSKSFKIESKKQGVPK